MVESKEQISPLSKHLEELRGQMLLPFITNMIIMGLIISFASRLILELLDSVNLNINELSSYSPVEYFKTKIYVSLIFSIIIDLLT